MEEAYALGAVDFLVKPLLPVVLQAKVRGFVELFQDKQRARHEADQLRLLVHGTDRLRHLHARPAGPRRHLERRGRADQGVQGRRDHRPALLPLLPAGGHRPGLARPRTQGRHRPKAGSRTRAGGSARTARGKADARSRPARTPRAPRGRADRAATSGIAPGTARRGQHAFDVVELDLLVERAKREVFHHALELGQVAGPRRGGAAR